MYRVTYENLCPYHVNNVFVKIYTVHRQHPTVTSVFIWREVEKGGYFVNVTHLWSFGESQMVLGLPCNRPEVRIVGEDRDTDPRSRYEKVIQINRILFFFLLYR